MLRWTKQAQSLTCLRDLLPATLQATLQGLAMHSPSDWQGAREFGTSAAPGAEFVALNNLADNPEEGGIMEVSEVLADLEGAVASVDVAIHKVRVSLQR